MSAGAFTAERLLALYDRVAEAEDAIPRLRRFVLDLAVRGKLVEQDAGDEPAAELLKRIAREKARLVTAGEIGPLKSARAIDLGDLPFSLPQAWAWSQIAAIGIVSPRVRAEDTDPASFVPMSMIAAELGVPHSHEVRRWGEVKKGYTTFAEGDVGLAKITPCFENRKSTVFRQLTGGVGAGTTELHVVRPIFVDPAYILIFLKSPTFIERGVPKMTGTAGQKRVPTEYFAASPFPLPPLAEQRRIVTKVDELMALCDRLEGARAGREAVRDRLTAATLTRLTAPETDAQTFPSHARFALQTLPILTTRPDQIKTLRQTILNLAVRGKLVAQDPSDEPAAELLKRIGKKRAALVAAGIAKKEKPVEAEAAPFTLPDSWSWCGLGQLCQLITKGSSPKWQGVSYVNGDIGLMFITSENVGNFTLRKLDDLKYVESRFRDVEPRSMLKKGDILINLVGASIGRTAIFDLDAEANINQAVALVRLVDPALGPSTDYLLMYLNSDTAVDQMLGSRVVTAQPNISLADVNGFPIPLPPLAEQHHIVAKVDALMALCDQLEASLTTATTTRSRLLEALLHEALGGAPGAQAEAAA